MDLLESKPRWIAFAGCHGGQKMRKKLLCIGVFLILVTTITGCSTAGGYDRAGKKNFTDGEYEKAAGNFSAAIKKNPNRAD